jgi:hypothetical protein
MNAFYNILTVPVDFNEQMTFRSLPEFLVELPSEIVYIPLRVRHRS